MNPQERDQMMLNALENIASTGCLRQTLSTPAQLINIVLKMQTIAASTLKQLERGFV